MEAKGWRVGTVAEFLELTPEESALIEIKLARSRRLRERRQERMTQAQLAEKDSIESITHRQSRNGA